MAPRIPEGWLDSTNVGKIIEGTRFIAFKVPLKETLCNNLRPKDRFTTTKLLELIPDLSLVIDLTNTCRYYNSNDLVAKGLEYEKISCPGKDVPYPKLVTRFVDVVDKFMKSANAKDKYIGVHCTHGINRTGYFICHYMVQKLGFKVQDAINTFQKARGHNIIRQYLINDLIKNFDPQSATKQTEIVDNTQPNRGNKRKWNHNSRAAPSPNKQVQQQDYSPRQKNKRKFDYNININIHPGNSSEPYLNGGPSHSDFSIRSNNGPTPRFNHQTQNRRYGDKPNQRYEPNRNRGNNRFYQPRNYNPTFPPREEPWKQDPFYRNTQTQLNYYDDEPSRTSYKSQSKFNWSKKNPNA